MFKCGICGKPSQPTEKAIRVITETRVKEYPYRKDANKIVVEGKHLTKDDRGGTGTEIVKEVLAHQKCAAGFVIAGVESGYRPDYDTRDREG